MSKSISIDSNLKELLKLALPVIATSFMSMAYNFINILFVGRLGSDAVAAVGSAGFFMNLCWGIASLFTVGVGIKVSHAMGQKNPQLARSYVRSGIQAVIVVALVCYLLIVLSRNFLIGIVGINDGQVVQSASTYLMLIGLSIPFNFQNLFFTSALIGYGDSKSPFSINATAFFCNMALDPIFIFLFDMGINGAALATLLSQALATLLFYRKLAAIKGLNPAGISFQAKTLREIVRLGVSPTIQRISFTLIAISMARIISEWGATAIAVQKVGVQIEAVSYMTTAGFMHALSSLSGKAYGAGKYDEQWRIFRSGMLLAVTVGILTSTLLIAFPKTLFSIFLNDAESLTMGSDYLVILGFSQVFMCLELMTTGAFFGWGRTSIPAITSISLTLLRIPMALAFIHFWSNSLSSVWWSISISSMAKGTLLVALYIILFKSFIKKNKYIRL